MPRRPDPNQLPLFLTPSPEEPPTQPTLSLDTPPAPSAPPPSVPLPAATGGEAPLPPPPDDPPEVAADIRAMFLEEEERQRAEETITIREGKPPLVTGIYRKPRPTAPKPLVLPLADPLRRPSTPPEGRPSASPRPQPPPPAPHPPTPTPTPSTPPPPRSPRPSPLTALRAYLSDAPLGPKGLLALLASILLVALLAWWSGSPKEPAPQEPTLASTDLPSDIPPPSPEVPRPAGDGGDTPSLPPPAPATPSAPTPPPTATASATAPATPPGTPAKGLRIPGATVTLTGDGAWRVQYTDAVFVSSDKISIEGMKALKATAAALLKLPGDVTVTIHGHTDDIPPPPDASGPYRTNADLATARATVAQEHLNVFCKRQSRFTFQVAPPSAIPAPYPNDTPAHRRLNRTITLRIAPSSLTPT